MDAHVRWARRLIVPRLLVRVALEMAIVAEIVFVGMVVGGAERSLALSWAVVIAQGVVLSRIVIALYTNPVNYRYLRDYVDNRPSLATSRLESVEGELAEFLSAHNLVPLATVHGTAGDGHPRADVFQSADRYVLAAVSDGVPTPMFISRVTDGRLLITTNLLVPPHTGLVVNHVRRRRLGILLERHVEVLERLHASGSSPTVAGVDAVAEMMRIEHSAWSDLGPFLGPFLAVGSRFKPLLLQVRIPSSTVLERTIVAPDGPLSRAELVPLPTSDQVLRVVDSDADASRAA